MGLIFPAISLLVLAMAWCIGRIATGTRAGARGLRTLIVLVGPILVVGAGLKVAGPLFWFSLPAWCFNPILNWVVVGTWTILVPLRNINNLAGSLMENRRLVSESRESPGPFTAWLQAHGFLEASLAAGLRNPPAVLIHPSLDQPRTLGLVEALSWRDRIVIPSAWVPSHLLDDSPYWSTFRLAMPVVEPKVEAELYAGILHELGHVRGRDTFAGLLSTLGSLAVPAEWQAVVPTQSPAGGRRTGSWIKRWMGWVGTPFNRLLLADLAGREWKADEFVGEVLPQPGGILESLRHGAGSHRPTEPSRFSLGVGLLAWLVAVPCALILMPGVAPLRLALGGSAGIKGSLPSGWEVLIWKAPKTPPGPSTTTWGYIPPVGRSSPLVELSLGDGKHMLILHSTFHLRESVRGPGMLHMEWDARLVQGEVEGAIELQMDAFELGEEETRGVYLPFRSQPHSALLRTGLRTVRIQRDLPVVDGLNAGVVHCYLVVSKPVSVLMLPPRITFQGPGGAVRSLGPGT